MKRRRYGDGSIFQRQDGRWCGVLSLHGKRKTVYGQTAQEVREKLRVLQRQREDGVQLGTKSQTVEQFLQTWLDTTVQQSCKPKTIESYTFMCQQYLFPHIGKYRLNTLTVEHLYRMVAALQEQGLAPRTIQYAVGVSSRAFNRAVEYGVIARNVATLVRVRVEKRVVKPLTIEQAHALLNAVKGHRLEALYRVALGLGLRRGEILTLRWSDIDLNNRSLTVRQSKTEAGARTLPLPERLMTALQKHWLNLQEARRSLGTEWKEYGLVFPSEVGTPVSPRNLVRQFKSTLKRAGLPQTIRFHDLRHSCATFLVAQGVHPRVAMEILGHSRISVTMDTYSHVLSDVQKNALEDIDQLLG
jgi:integrase